MRAANNRRDVGSNNQSNDEGKKEYDETYGFHGQPLTSYEPRPGERTGARLGSDHAVNQRGRRAYAAVSTLKVRTVAVDPILAADLSVAADPILAADPSAVWDRYGEAAHTAAQNAVVADPSAPAAPNAAAVLRSAALALNGVRNVATNAVQTFPSVQHDRVSLVLPEDPKARNVALRSAAIHC